MTLCCHLMSGLTKSINMTVLIISYSDIDLTRTTINGLEFLLEIMINEEEYEKAADVRDELLKRNSIIER